MFHCCRVSEYRLTTSNLPRSMLLRATCRSSSSTHQRSRSRNQRKTDYKPNDTFACLEKGDMTGTIFSSFISQELLPYINKRYPDIKMSENELLLLIDKPSTQDLTPEVRELGSQACLSTHSPTTQRTGVRLVTTSFYLGRGTRCPSHGKGTSPSDI